ncbi:MAG: ABC transporter ATP-binding protein [Anaerolinea sp.]|nr:ABC transporter ATP-binding protein [Anaerolinea sp.]
MDVTFESVQFARDRWTVLDVPELRLRAGRVTALLGPNGAGKSTLLRLIAGLEAPTAGTVRIGERTVTGARQVRDLVAFSFQEPVFLTGSVRANLTLGLELRKVPRDAQAQRVGAAATALGITGLLRRNAHRLSGGEGQRVNLARALALRAPVTLLDEPLAGLDAPAQRQMLDDLPGLLAEFAPTTILVTHVREEAMRLADDLVVLMDGRVRAAGEMASVLRTPPDDETARFLGYTVLPAGNSTIAVPAWQLVPGVGTYTFQLAVRSVVDTGFGMEVAGTIAGETVRVAWVGAAPSPGEAVTVSWTRRG